MEDFSQLMGYSKETKYESSMEKLVPVIEKHCTFPLIEKLKLFRLVIFNFLVGNEDMHLKNFSLIRRENKVELSPAYDLLNSSLVIKSGEEIALPLRSKKSNLNRSDLIDYFGIERLSLPENTINQEMLRFAHIQPTWTTLIQDSFLSRIQQKKYVELLQKRFQRLK